VWQSGKAGPDEHGLSFTDASHVHERHLRSGRRDRVARPRDVRERLAAERSSEVSQENEKQRCSR
jgi:hypothetical protein